MLEKLRFAKQVVIILALGLVVFGSGALQSVSFAVLVVNLVYNSLVNHYQIQRAIKGDPTIDPQIAAMMVKIDGIISPQTVLKSNAVLSVGGLIFLSLMRYGPFWLAALLSVLSIAVGAYNLNKGEQKLMEDHLRTLDDAIENYRKTSED